ncbi:MAG: hypothetical protein ABIT83_05745 [Massilia sp.]
MADTIQRDWTVMESQAAHVDEARDRCRKLVRRRAVMAASVSAIPIPGVDLVSDVSLFVKLVDEVNQEFGLSAEQVERMQPKFKLIAYRAVVGVGAMLVGRLMTRELIIRVFRRAGVKIAAKTAAKIVPVAGQVVSAAIGFAMFRQLGYKHVEDCARVATEMMAARPA